MLGASLDLQSFLADVGSVLIHGLRAELSGVDHEILEGVSFTVEVADKSSTAFMN